MAYSVNPYTTLAARNFWAPAVGKRHPFDIDELWVPKWEVTPMDKVVTFGSCFAQHFGKALAECGFSWTNMEPPPEGLNASGIKKFNYNVFSARTGNIYTTNMLRQWCDWATGASLPPEEIWQAEGRFYDPFRPAIEPEGFETEQELRENRDFTIAAFGAAMRMCDLFVFTMGLTETWRSGDHSYEYAICPGTAAGQFDPERHVFVNERYPETLHALELALAAIRAVNPDVRVLLTVSPVPLTATASNNHVLVATTYSKSVLRAVAGDVAAKFDWVDYFPSYEMITAPPFGGQFFDTNKRSVLSDGVTFVMSQFFSGLAGKYGEPDVLAGGAEAGMHVGEADQDADQEKDDLVCEEAILAAFGPKV